MSKLRTALISIIGLACVLGGVAVQADSGALKQKVDAVIDQAIAEDRIVGTVVLIEQDGKLVYERAAGLADKEPASRCNWTRSSACPRSRSRS